MNPYEKSHPCQLRELLVELEIYFTQLRNIPQFIYHIIQQNVFPLNICVLVVYNISSTYH